MSYSGSEKFEDEFSEESDISVYAFSEELEDVFSDELGDAYESDVMSYRIIENIIKEVLYNISDSYDLNVDNKIFLRFDKNALELTYVNSKDDSSVEHEKAFFYLARANSPVSSFLELFEMLQLALSFASMYILHEYDYRIVEDELPDHIEKRLEELRLEEIERLNL